jgi:cellulose synthase/poly-beta-1,6-N-acetylglucosamine synthase-like glycosyltransferase
MDLVLSIAVACVALSGAGAALVLAGYPLLLWLAAAAAAPTRRRPVPRTGDTRRVSILIAARNAEDLIEKKVRDSLDLSLPAGEIELVVVSDGSTDSTTDVLVGIADPRLKTIAVAEHRGKAQALNAGFDHCTGDIVVFSDVDASIAQTSFERLLRPFGDPAVGGVCGRRVVASAAAGLDDAQGRYIDFDSWIKTLESHLGSITSNDGKLYAARRDLFQSIPDAVTDDLFVLLSVVRRQRRFVFAPAATATIPAPSRNPAHELVRRRRIVSTSLRCIRLQRAVLNPRHFGFYALGLFINKVLRRLLPVFLLLLYLSTGVLAPVKPWAAALFWLQSGFYLLALVGLLGMQRPSAWRPMGRITSLASYFVLGNAGTLLGVIAFLRGRCVVKWDPVKGVQVLG